MAYVNNPLNSPLEYAPFRQHAPVHSLHTPLRWTRSSGMLALPLETHPYTYTQTSGMTKSLAVLTGYELGYAAGYARAVQEHTEMFRSLTLQEVADVLSMSPQNVRKLLQRGIIKGAKRRRGRNPHPVWHVPVWALKEFQMGLCVAAAGLKSQPPDLHTPMR